MKLFQQTIKKAVTVSGVGLHSGLACNTTFQPAKANHGIIFQRTDISGQPLVHADIDFVVDTHRGTSLEENGIRVDSVEHILASLAGLEIDNMLIQLDSPEPPTMDGSAMKFVEAIEIIGIEELNAQRNFFEVPESVFYQDKENDVEIAALPLDDYRMTVVVDYNSKVLGSQHATLNSLDEFKEQIANSRNFCFLHEIEEMHQQGLIKGGDLTNAIVIVDKEVTQDELDRLAKLLGKPKVEVTNSGILNNVKLRHKNEAARHKLLDLMGDLALLGRPIKAQILGARPGHEANVAFAKKLRQLMLESKPSKIPQYDPKLPAVVDINNIQRILPHRYPFLMIDKIFHLDDETVAGIKNVTFNEPYFAGHFPGNPVMPGVLQVEAMAQIGGILILNTVPDPENYWTYFLGLENFKFRKMVVPGDTLIIRCELMQPIRRGFAKMKGYAYVGNNLVCEGIMTASIVRKDT